jgi:hypothetical protein
VAIYWWLIQAIKIASLQPKHSLRSWAGPRAQRLVNQGFFWITRLPPARNLAGGHVYCGMVEEKESLPFLAAGSEVVSCSLTRAIKASVEFDSGSLAASAAFLAEAAAFGGITTVLRKSSSSTSGLSSVTPSSAEPRSKSTGGLGGITLAAGGAFAAGFIDGMGADPSGAVGAGARGGGAAAAAGSSIAGIGADAKGDGLSKTTASFAGCESAAVSTGAGS